MLSFLLRHYFYPDIYVAQKFLGGRDASDFAGFVMAFSGLTKQRREIVNSSREVSEFMKDSKHVILRFTEG